MLEISENFQAQLDNGGTPAHIVHVQEDVIEAEKAFEADWAANTAENNVDYTSSPPNAGDVELVWDDSWLARADLTAIRAGCTSVFYNGKIYVYGGYDGSTYQNTLYEYDPSGNSLTTKTAGPTGIANHVAVVIGTKMYVQGGDTGGPDPQSTVWEYDFTGNSWTTKTIGSTTQRFWHHTAVAYNSNMYVYGGSGGSSTPVQQKNIWEYNPGTNSWALHNIAGPYRYSPTAVLHNDKIVTFGGQDGTIKKNTVWIYDFILDSWEQKTSGATARAFHSAAYYAGFMYIHSGDEGAAPATSYLNDMWIYDIDSDWWEEKTSGGTARGYTGMTASETGEIYVSGGYDSVSYYKENWKYTTGYSALGSLTTDNFDLGSTPTIQGEWQMQDTKPDGTALTYEAWSSATGVFGGEETSLGTVADGDSITNLKRYYRVKPSLAANTARDKTPTLHSIKADFSTHKTFTDCLRIAQENDYEMGLMPISGISSEINDFKESTIGQITPTLDFNESVSKYLYGKYPKNKIIKVLIGFDDPDFAVSDFLEFFRGQVVDYTITSDDKVNLITQAFQVEWSKKIPETWEDSGDDVTWTDMHPTDVMLDIIRNYMDVRDSKIVASSFADVKALIPSFRVTRTITKQPVEAKKLMEELRLLTGCYFLPSSAGKIKIKRFDSTEAVVATLTDDNTKGTSYKGNLKSLINKTLVYYGHDGEGDDAVDYTKLQLDVSTGATSNENWGEWKTKEIKDKWTLAADSAQVISMSDDQLARYKDPPAIIQRVGDKKLLYIEAGDMVAVTIKRAPSADGVSGIIDKKFQVIRPSLDFKGNKVTLTLLEA